MAQISTRYHYFFHFGGYSGLQHVLADDLVEIPDLSESEVVQPGTYTNLVVSEIIRHGRNRFTVHFSTQDLQFVCRQDCTAGTWWYRKLVEFGGLGSLVDLRLVRNRREYVAGYLHDTYYLIRNGQVEVEFDSAAALRSHCYAHDINLGGVKIDDIRTSQASTSSKA